MFLSTCRHAANHYHHIPVRSFSNRHMSTFVRDIYKTIGYQAPFSEAEKRQILSRLNCFDEAQLARLVAKKNAKNILMHRENVGEFNCVEQLLDVDRIETKLLEKIGKDLLKEEKQDSNRAEVQQLKRLETYFQKDIYPRPDANIFSTLENPVTIGLKINLKSVAFAAVDKENLVSWKVVPLFANVASQTNYLHYNLFHTTQTIINSLPQGHFYVLDDLLPLLPKDPFFKTKVNLIRVRSFLFSSLIGGTGRSPLGVHTIKPSVVDKMFNLKVGNERISLQDQLPSIVEEKHLAVNPFRTKISEEEWEVYNSSGKSEAENMGAALLQALSFNHLCRVFRPSPSPSPSSSPSTVQE